jgi:hypothetical protein
MPALITPSPSPSISPSADLPISPPLYLSISLSLYLFSPCHELSATPERPPYEQNPR